MEFILIVLIIAVLVVSRGIKVVPQQHAWVVERLGKYDRTLAPGLNFIVPFVDRVSYRHLLKEIPLDIASQVCITRDNTQLTVDGILYFQVTDPMRASYGSSNYVLAISQLAQTTLRSVIGRMELDKTFEEREFINHSVVSVLDEAASSWGVKVLRYEIKDLTPPAEILHAMQRQITAEREKRAVIATSEGARQQQINQAEGERQAAINRAEGDRQALIERSAGERQAAINRAEGEAQALQTVAAGTAQALELVAAAISHPGGADAVQLKVAQQALEAYANLAKSSTTLVVPGDMSSAAGLVASAMAVLKTTR